MTQELLENKSEPEITAAPETTTGAQDLSGSTWQQRGSDVKLDSVPQGFHSLWKHRHLIEQMVRRDFLGRYKGSLLGVLWPFINPLGHMALYIFLFSVILKIKFGNDPSTSSFAIYLMAGLLPWTVFSEALARSTTVILESPNLVNRVVFPLEILPPVLTISSLLSASVNFALILGAVLVCTGHLHATVMFVPLILLSQIILTAGITWLLASVGVFIRDLSHIMALAMSAWMYATPIVYPASKIPDNLKFLLWANPLAGIVTDYRRVILEGNPPDWAIYGCYTTTACLLCYLGFAFFQKTKKSFADVM